MIRADVVAGRRHPAMGICSFTWKAVMQAGHS